MLGKSVETKLEELRAHIESQNAYGTVVSALDEIAWLFNLRGSDIECNPVFFSYAIITGTEAILYLDLDKVTEQVERLLSSSITLKPYSVFFTDLEELNLDGKKLLVNNKTSLAVEVAVGEVIQITYGQKKKKKKLIPKFRGYVDERIGRKIFHYRQQGH